MQLRPGAASGGRLVGRRRRLVAVLGVAVVVAAVLIGLRLATGTQEPAALVGAEPADGARLAAPPAEVSLTFSAEVDAGATHVIVVDPDGTPRSAGEPVVRGGTVRQPVEITGAGPLVVAYHVTFRDGRELSGQQRFVVGTAAGEVPPEAAEGALAAAEEADGGPHDHGRLGPLAGAAALAIVAGGATVLTVAFRRR